MSPYRRSAKPEQRKAKRHGRATLPGKQFRWLLAFGEGVIIMLCALQLPSGALSTITEWVTVLGVASMAAVLIVGWAAFIHTARGFYRAWRLHYGRKRILRERPCPACENQGCGVYIHTVESWRRNQGRDYLFDSAWTISPTLERGKRMRGTNGVWVQETNLQLAHRLRLGRKL